MTKVLDQAIMPGAHPDMPKKFGQGPECTKPGCKRASRQQGLCLPCSDDHTDAQANELDVDALNEKMEKAKNS